MHPFTFPSQYNCYTNAMHLLYFLCECSHLAALQLICCPFDLVATHTCARTLGRLVPLLLCELPRLFCLFSCVIDLLGCIVCSITRMPTQNLSCAEKICRDRVTIEMIIQRTSRTRATFSSAASTVLFTISLSLANMFSALVEVCTQRIRVSSA